MEGMGRGVTKNRMISGGWVMGEDKKCYIRSNVASLIFSRYLFIKFAALCSLSKS